jgi:hypothetical protein
MPQPQRDKVVIMAASAEVEELASYLDHLIKDRTSENKFLQAANVGKSKLTGYLNGMHVPHARVLTYYFLPALNKFRPVTDDELATLMELHQKASQVRPPKEPTPDDQVNFLREDLEHAQSRLADLTKRLNRAIYTNLAHSEQIAQMGQTEEGFRAQVGALTAQAAALRRDLRQARREHELSLMGADRKLAAFTEEKRRELEACQGQISALEKAMSGYVRLEARVDNLTLENVSLHSRIADERRLFMGLVVHAANAGPLARLSERHERGEETIAELAASNTVLTETNKNLTATNEALVAELDRVTQERDFLRATATPPTPAQPFPFGWNSGSAGLPGPGKPGASQGRVPPRGSDGLS